MSTKCTETCNTCSNPQEIDMSVDYFIRENFKDTDPHSLLISTLIQLAIKGVLGLDDINGMANKYGHYRRYMNIREDGEPIG